MIHLPLKAMLMPAIVLLSLWLTAVHGYCSICPDGSPSFNVDKFVPSLHTTCLELERFAAFSEDKELCSAARQHAAWCECPGAQPACTFCPEGMVPKEADHIIPKLKRTCGDFVYFAAVAPQGTPCNFFDIFVVLCGGCVSSSLTDSPIDYAIPTASPVRSPTFNIFDDDLTLVPTPTDHVSPTESPANGPRPTRSPTKVRSPTSPPANGPPPTKSPVNLTSPTDSPIDAPSPTRSPVNVQAPSGTSTKASTAPSDSSIDKPSLTKSPLDAQGPTNSPVDIAAPTQVHIDIAAPTDIDIDAPTGVLIDDSISYKCGGVCPDGTDVPNPSAIMYLNEDEPISCGRVEAILGVSNPFETCALLWYKGVKSCGCKDILPPVPEDALCSLCENESTPPNLSYQVLPGYTCRDLAYKLASDIDHCPTLQATIGVYCGCKNDVAPESVCRLCGDKLLPDPSRIPDENYRGLSCGSLEFSANGGDLTCADMRDSWASACCDTTSTTATHSISATPSATTVTATPSISAAPSANSTVTTSPSISAAPSAHPFVARSTSRRPSRKRIHFDDTN